MKNYLEGAYDLHLHTAPDVVERKLDDFEMAQRAAARNMRGFVIKNHYEDTAPRVLEVRKQYPDLEIYGGIALNLTVGSLNPGAVEKSAQMDGRFVWFPTLDAKHWNSFMNKDSQGKLSILENGKLVDKVYDILDVVKQYNLILCTGHLSYEEAIALVREAHSRKIGKIILTHADSPSVFTSSAQQMDFVKLGAVIEHSSLNLETGKTAWEVMVGQIRDIGCEHIILSSDLGQVENPYPDDSLNDFVRRLFDAGLNEAQVRKMIRENPIELLKK